LFASGNALRHFVYTVAMTDITVAIVGRSMQMSELIPVLVVIYIVVMVGTLPFVALSEKHYGDDNWFRYSIFWPAYVLRWLVVNFILAIKGL